MKDINDNITGNHLYNYYQKKIHSILISISEIKAIHSAEDIHNLRVGIKKLRAVFQLCEMVAPKKIDAKNNYSIFEAIFDQAGKIREMQINHFFIDQYKLPESNAALYKEFIHRKEKKNKKKFNDMINEFNTGKINEIDSEIKKTCKKISKEELISHSQKFISKKTTKIKNISGELSNKTLHKKRMYLKSIGTLLTLLHSINPTKKITKTMNNVHKAEEAIGNWHDLIVFEASLKAFLKNVKTKEKKELNPLEKLLNQLTLKNSKTIKLVSKKIELLLPEL